MQTPPPPPKLTNFCFIQKMRNILKHMKNQFRFFFRIQKFQMILRIKENPIKNSFWNFFSRIYVSRFRDPFFKQMEIVEKNKHCYYYYIFVTITLCLNIIVLFWGTRITPKTTPCRRDSNPHQTIPQANTLRYRPTGCDKRTALVRYDP